METKPLPTKQTTKGDMAYKGPPFGSRALTERVDSLYSQESERTACKVAISRTNTQECKQIMTLGDQACKDVLNQLVNQGNPGFWKWTTSSMFLATLLVGLFSTIFNDGNFPIHIEPATVMAALKSWVVIGLFTLMCSVSRMWRFAGHFWRHHPGTRKAVTAIMSVAPLLAGRLLHICHKQACLEALWVLPPFFTLHAWVVLFTYYYWC